MQLDKKVVLITGASAGIGRACARAFRSRGSRLSLVARSAEELKEIGGADSVITVGDITEEQTRRRAVESTIERFGAIDVLVNNAGMGLYSAAWNAPMPETRRLFELNLFAPLALIQLVVPHMQRRRAGAIVNVGSIAGKVTLPWFTLYSVTKFALGSLTDGLRMELKDYGIHAMIVCPGYVKTDFQTHALGTRPPDAVMKGKKFAITAEQCAEAIVRGVERNARTVVTPRVAWILVALDRLFPKFMEARMSAINQQRTGPEEPPV